MQADLPFILSMQALAAVAQFVLGYVGGGRSLNAGCLLGQCQKLK